MQIEFFTLHKYNGIPWKEKNHNHRSRHFSPPALNHSPDDDSDLSWPHACVRTLSPTRHLTRRANIAYTHHFHSYYITRPVWLLCISTPNHTGDISVLELSSLLKPLYARSFAPVIKGCGRICICVIHEKKNVRRCVYTVYIYTYRAISQSTYYTCYHVWLAVRVRSLSRN